MSDPADGTSSQPVALDQFQFYLEQLQLDFPEAEGIVVSEILQSSGGSYDRAKYSLQVSASL